MADEAVWISQKGLMDCRVEYDGKLYHQECQSTCGGMNQPWLANIYLMLFVTMSTVILLQLVIAVLMDQFTQAGEGGTALIPHCQHLSLTVLLRIKNRLRRKAELKLKASDRWIGP